MNHNHKFATLNNQEHGAVLIETALVVPLLVFMLLSVFDIGLMLCKHMEISRISYEGARYAASLPGFDQTLVNNATYEFKVNQHMQRLFSIYGLSAEESQVDLNYTKVGEVSHIQVSFSTAYSPLTPLFSAITQLRTQANTPYLYPITDPQGDAEL